MKLDFSQINDDQLLQLIQATMGEAVQRGGAIAYGANKAYVDAAEALKIQADVAQKAAELDLEKEREEIKRRAEEKIKKEAIKDEQAKRQRVWEKKKAIFDALKQHPLFVDDTDYSINIWARDADVRVYIQQDKKRRGWEVCYYQGGNRYNSPGTVTGLDDKSNVTAIAAFCELLIKKWKIGFKCSFESTQQVKISHPDAQKDYEQYLSALEIKTEVSNV